MTIDERCDKRVGLCRKLRDLEKEIEKTSDIKNKYEQSTGNKKVSILIYVDNENIQYSLDKNTAKCCIELIENSYLVEKDSIIQALKQELR